jgi:hypothetical protein
MHFHYLIKSPLACSNDAHHPLFNPLHKKSSLDLSGLMVPPRLPGKNNRVLKRDVILRSDDFDGNLREG